MVMNKAIYERHDVMDMEQDAIKKYLPDQNEKPEMTAKDIYKIYK